MLNVLFYYLYTVAVSSIYQEKNVYFYYIFQNDSVLSELLGELKTENCDYLKKISIKIA